MASQRLGDILMARGILTSEVWERAQRLAAERGGTPALWLARAGSDPAAVIGALAHAGVPVAREQALLDAPADLVRKLPAPVAVRLGAVPVGMEDDRMVVAMADPFDHDTAVALASASGMRVRGRAADHRHLARAVEHHYGRRPPGWESGGASGSEAASPAGGALSELFRPPEPHEPVVDLTRPKARTVPPAQPARASGLAGGGVSGPGTLKAESDLLGSASSRAPSPGRGGDDAPLSAAVAAIQEAADRDAVLEAALRGLGGLFPRVAIFLRQGDTYVGRTATGGFVTEHVRTLSLPADLGGLAWRVAGSGEAWVGGLPDDVEEDLLFAELRPLPGQVALLPVLVRGKAVLLMYADSPGNLPLAELEPSLLGLAEAVGEALERIILRRKLG